MPVFHDGRIDRGETVQVIRQEERIAILQMLAGSLYLHVMLLAAAGCKEAAEGGEQQ